MTIAQDDILKTTTGDEVSTNESIKEILDTQKQLDQELKHLKNKYSRYSQIVTSQQDEESKDLKKYSLIKNSRNEDSTEKVNSEVESEEKNENEIKGKNNSNMESEIKNEEVTEEEEQEKEMSRLCNLVQSLLTEAQDAIESKPEVHTEEDSQVDNEDYDLPLVPKRLDSLNGHHTDINIDENKTQNKMNNRYSILTDTTAVAQTSTNYDLDSDFDFSRYSSPRSAYFYPPNESTSPYMSNHDYYYKMYGSNPAINELNQANLSFDDMYRLHTNNIYKERNNNLQPSSTNAELIPHSNSKRRRHHRRHHRHRSHSRHIRPLDSNGEPCSDSKVCPVHSSVEKKPSKLFKAQFGSDTQLFISFFTSFFVTSILVTISCLWSVIQVMSGNVNDGHLSRLLKSSSESAISKNKRRIEKILEKDDSSVSNSEDESDEENSSAYESEKENRLIKGNQGGLHPMASTDSLSSKYYTAPTSPLIGEEEEIIKLDHSYYRNGSNTTTTTTPPPYFINSRRNSL